METYLDINCDLGEIDDGRDDLIMPFLNSCNIACGGHIGDYNSMYKTVSLAKKHGLRIGAHPSYPDRLNFGRKSMDLDTPFLCARIKEQVNALEQVCTELNVEIDYIKPHGALYNDLAKDENFALGLLNFMKSTFPDYKVMGLANSSVDQVAKRLAIPFIKEGFMDRRYKRVNELQSRNIEGAVLSSVKEVWSQVNDIINKQIDTIQEGFQPIDLDSICIHSDTDNSRKIAKSIHRRLTDLGKIKTNPSV